MRPLLIGYPPACPQSHIRRRTHSIEAGLKNLERGLCTPQSLERRHMVADLVSGGKASEKEASPGVRRG
ncbi:MAG: hypothetical protein ACM3SW_19910 [Actinomycetota bacterium]